MFLDDETVSVEPRHEEDYSNIEVRNLVAINIAYMLGTEVEVDLNRTAAGWATPVWASTRCDPTAPT